MVNHDQTDDTNVNCHDVIKSIGNFRVNHPKNLIVCHYNVNSIRNKFHELSSLLTDQSVDVLAISETKLDDSFPRAQFQILNIDFIVKIEMNVVVALWYMLKIAYRIVSSKNIRVLLKELNICLLSYQWNQGNGTYCIFINLQRYTLNHFVISYMISVKTLLAMINCV